MLLTLLYLGIKYYTEWRDHSDKMKYMNLVQKYLGHASLVFRRKALSQEGSVVLLESQGSKEVVAVKPEVHVSLDGWTLFFSSRDTVSVDGSSLCHAVLSTKHPDNEGSFLQTSLSIPRHRRVKLSQFAEPLAWKPDELFQILVRCTTKNLASVVQAFMQDRLVTDDMLEVLQIQVVHPEGTADSLFPDLQSSKEEQTERKNITSHEKIGANKQHTHLVDGALRRSDSGDTEHRDIQKQSNTQNVAKTPNTNQCQNDDRPYYMHKGTSGMKPPNVMLYCGKKDSQRLYEAAKKSFEQCVNSDRLLIYHLKHDQVLNMPWADNTQVLLICSDKVYDGVDKEFLKYFENGGCVVSFSSAFDCLVTSREQISSAVSVSKLTYKEWRDLAVICGRHVYQDEPQSSARLSKVQLDVIGRDGHGRPVIIRATHMESAGIAILSQVNLDKDPIEMAISPEVFNMLKQANASRLAVLRQLLTGVGVDCSQKSIPPLTPSFLFTKTEDQRSQFLENIEPRLKNGVLKSRSTSLNFVNDEDNIKEEITSNLLPVVTSGQRSRPLQYFDAVTYMNNLDTKCLGQVVVYTEVVPTTMTLLDGLLFSVPDELGMVAIAGRQTQGKGRGGNAWISPEGCAMFTAHVRLPVASELGQRVAYLQHLVSLAVVEGVLSLPGYQELDLRLKWPNDLYFGDKMKLGGVIVNSTMMGGTIHALIGCGVNVCNSNPNICINDVVDQWNIRQGTSLCPLRTEEVIGRTLTSLENLIDVFQNGGKEAILPRYYKRWLHSGAKVRLESLTGPEAEVVGVDDHGYLTVVTADGEKVTAHPDGNSFDMLRNLILRKS